MYRTIFAKSRLLAVLLAPACAAALGTASGAADVSVQASTTTTSTTTSTVGVAAPNPELENADHKVESLKSKLENARAQLSTAKAMVKAAEAELKAARADREAIALRQNAQQLADASGFVPPANVDPVSQVIVPANGGKRLTPVAMPQGDAAAPAKALPADFNSAPAAPDLRPTPAGEPNMVP